MGRSPRALFIAGAALLLAVAALIWARPKARLGAGRVAEAEAKAGSRRTAGRYRRPSVAGLSTAGLVMARGRVVDERGQGIASARVTTGGPSVVYDGKIDDPEDEVEADANGAFEVLVRPGVFSIAASARGFRAEGQQARSDGESITLTLARGATVAGRVVRADTGAPVSGAEVEGAIGGWPVPPMITDAEGRFRGEDVRPAPYALVARAPGLYGRSAVAISFAESEPSEEATIAVHPVAELRGRLEVASTGAPCPGGEVDLSAGNERMRATAGDDGAVYFPALFPGKYDAQLTCAGHAFRQTGQVVEVGGEALTVSFPVGEERSLRGVVVDESGAPVRGERVITIESDEPRRRPMGILATRSDGTFEIHNLEAGPLLLHASSREQAPEESLASVERVRVEAGASGSEVRLVSPALHDLWGRVVDDEGRPIPDASLTLRRDDNHRQRITKISADGRFLATGLARGALWLDVIIMGQLVGPRGSATRVTLPVTEGVTIVVPRPRGRLEGRVLGAMGDRPIVRVTARCTTAGSLPTSYPIALADVDQRFSIPVPPGAVCALSADTDLGETARLEGATEGKAVELHLLPGGTLRGVVKGAPDLFEVSLSYGHVERFFRTGGAWELRGVLPGEHFVSTYFLGRRAQAQVQVKAGETQVVDLRLEPASAPAADRAPEPREAAEPEEDEEPDAFAIDDAP